jgi:hypothetical protein
MLAGLLVRWDSLNALVVGSEWACSELYLLHNHMVFNTESLLFIVFPATSRGTRFKATPSEDGCLSTTLDSRNFLSSNSSNAYSISVGLR